MRVKGGFTTRRRHKKIIKANKGYRGPAGNVFRRAKEAWLKAGEHMYRSRKQKKRDFRQLWIIRISAALELLDYKYSRFVGALGKKNIQINRKVLSEMAIHHKPAFKKLVEEVMK